MALSGNEELFNRNYSVSWVAEWFHKVPHIDYTFSPVNSTFDPRSNLYLESLGIIASLPGFWLILNLLSFLIFFLSRCCERDWKKKNITCYRWTLAILGLLCCGVVGAGFYGNEDTHSGVDQFTAAMQRISNAINAIKNQTLSIEGSLDKNIRPDLDELDKIFRLNLPNKTAQTLLRETVQAMRADVASGAGNVAEINNRVRSLDAAGIPKTSHQVEIIRWPVTMAVLSTFLLFCIILLAGVIMNSRSTLIAFTVLGLLAVIINWLLVSIYLASCVGLSDFCLDADQFMQRQASGMLDRALLNYYFNCTDGMDIPFKKAINDGQRAVDSVGSKLQFLSRVVFDIYTEGEISQKLRSILGSLEAQLNRTDGILAGMVVLLDCHQLHDPYRAALSAVCMPLLNGLAFMLASAVTAGLFFILLIWVAAHTWIYIRKRSVGEESDFVQVDQQDPFLPPIAGSMSTPPSSARRQRDASMSGGRPRHSHTPPQTPPFPGTYNGRIPRGTDEHSPLHGRYTPPPSYEQLSPFLPQPSFKS